MKWEFSSASRERKLSPGSRTGRAIDDLVTMLLGARTSIKLEVEIKKLKADIAICKERFPPKKELPKAFER
jgi:hypothetical protein